MVKPSSHPWEGMAKPTTISTPSRPLFAQPASGGIAARAAGDKVAAQPTPREASRRNF